MPSIIVQRDGPLLLEDLSCPVNVIQVGDGRVLYWKDIADAAGYTGIPVLEIPALATTEATKDGFSFRYPTLKELKARYPTYVVQRIHEHLGPKPVTVEVTLRKLPGVRVPDRLFYRTITSCCSAWGISKETFDRITNQHLGWQDLLPGLMASIRTNVKIPKKYHADGANPGALPFTVRKVSTGYRIDASSLHGKVVKRLQDLPGVVLAHATYPDKKK